MNTIESYLTTGQTHFANAIEYLKNTEFYQYFIFLTTELPATIMQFLWEFSAELPYLPWYFSVLFYGSIIITVLSLVFTAICIIFAYILAIYTNAKNWKPKPNSQLMYSYFGGSGFFQRKLIYKSAFDFMLDVNLVKFTFLGIAGLLKSIESKSTILLFLFAILYFILEIFGIIEIIFRFIFGGIFFFVFGIFHWIILLVLTVAFCLLMPIAKLVDKILRNEQHCPNCYTKFNLQLFKCKSCGVYHENLLPSLTGILFARCLCGKFTPANTIIRHFHRLQAACPVCKQEVVAVNAVPFSIQLIGAENSGKTAFLAFFQYLYFNKNNVQLIPNNNFAQLQEMYQNGKTFPTETSANYNFVFLSKLDNQVLTFYDISSKIVQNFELDKPPTNFIYCNAFIIMINPATAMDETETAIINFINKFSEITGKSATKMTNKPVAVIINKSDNITLPKFNKNLKKYVHETSKICRQYLVDIGLINTINNIEGVFANVGYFIMSTGEFAKNTTGFPVTWLAVKSKSELSHILEDNLM
ncbi:MAG: hypothetical protein FWG64_06785 [Firmicutes bacterium]|nr:hypothetical protein [Bacillota bacterium]